MKNWMLKALWAGLFLLCGVMGFWQAEGWEGWLLLGLSVLMFLPPAWLLVEAWREKDAKELKLLAILSAASLAVTLVLMVANLLSVLAPQWLGDVLHFLLVVLGAPLMCGQYWFVGPGLWAAVLFTSLEGLREVKK